MNKHNTPSNADWCSHGKGWTVDCEPCGRTALHAFLPGGGLSNNTVRVRLEMLEHAVFTKTSSGSPPVPVPLGNSLAPEAMSKNPSSASRLDAQRGEPGEIFTRKRLDQLVEMFSVDSPYGYFDSRELSRTEKKELVRGYLELVELAESIEKRLGGVRT